MAEGIEVRHSRACATRDGKRCNCEPGYRVVAYDPVSKRKASKTFSDTREKPARWRATAQTQTAKGVRLAGTSQTLRDASEPFLAGIAGGAIQNTSRRPLQASSRA